MQNKKMVKIKVTVTEPDPLAKTGNIEDIEEINITDADPLDMEKEYKFYIGKEESIRIVLDKAKGREPLI